MKKILMMMLGALLAVNAAAVPANPQPMTYTQPDGTTVTVKLCGDEFYNFSTTTDGYTVVKNTAGFWVYAQRSGSALVPSTVVAHDQANRSAAEQAFLAAITQRLTDLNGVSRSKQVRAQSHAPSRAASFDVSKFRGLVILVQPSDVAFQKGNESKTFYNTVINSKNFTGGSAYGGTWTGSVRDYYYDNSNGNFDPEFDVVGPFKVTQASTTFHNNSTSPFREALEKANYDVDFSQYDGNNDGKVDMVFFLVAGFGSNIEGNNNGLLWPHKGGGVGNGKYDGKYIDVYACSTEMGGSSSWGYIDGIGVICHEFTHVLGFPDLYDADYATNGQTHDPGEWDIMAGGSYHNNSRTPAGYSIFERYALGFANPTTITGEGSFTLESVAKSNTGFILRTPVNKEYFIIENRQRADKWDYYLPGHGMLVTRVDSTNAYYWVANQVNNFESHMYYELLRAGNTSAGAWASDPFPGTYGIPNLTNYTIPNLHTWNGTANSYEIMRITEKNQVISFDVVRAGNSQRLVETFNRIGLTSTEAKGDIATWKLAQCSMTEVEGSNRAVAMKNPSVLMMTTPISDNITQVSFDVNNTSSDVAKLGLSYTTDNGSTWKAASNSVGQTTTQIAGGAKMVSYWSVALSDDQSVRFRVSMTGGSKTAPCIIDNFTIFYSDEAEYAADIQPSVLEFGDVNLGESKTKSFTIYNRGKNPFTPTLSGISPVFTVNYTPAALQAGKSVTIPVTYTPATATSSSNKVTVNCGNAGSLQVYFTGKGVKNTVRGDLNGDGIVDVTDVDIIIDMVLGKRTKNLQTADLDGNGIVDVSDVNILIDIVLGKN